MFYYVSLVVLSIIVFEGVKEFFVVAIKEQSLLKKEYSKFKENKYIKYFLVTRFVPIFRAIKQPKVFYPVVFFYLHEYFLHEIALGNEINLSSSLFETSINLGLLMAGAYALYIFYLSGCKNSKI